MRAPKTIASRSSLRRSAKPPTPPPISKHAEELMELAVEAARSRHLPDFLEQFALRSAGMLEASWGGVAVYLGRETKFHAMRGSGGSTFSSGEEWVLSNARECRSEMETRTLPKEIAAALPCAEEPEEVLFVRIASSDNEK